MESKMKELIYTESDLFVTPILDNPKIMKQAPVRFDLKMLHIPAHSGENHDILHRRAKIARVIALLALHTTELKENVPVTEVPSSGRTIQNIVHNHFIIIYNNYLDIAFCDVCLSSEKDENSTG
ncbi:Serine/threonine-protein kinase ULK4 [Chelonia mydas]|uniref:Serine/threonine-protein kinase ULK4 n=1 Tax=Chelonia mydas TaxID=8469 RepID=M7B3D8_CHEMY|nr:Serine/threonine-protein kinase ULK4 [Chelonia mydas]